MFSMKQQATLTAMSDVYFPHHQYSQGYRINKQKYI